MKKMFLVLPLLFLSAVAFAGSPVYFPQSTNCISVYAVGGGTISAASVSVFVSSIEFVSAGGLYPGTTNIDFYNASFDTIDEVVTRINTMPATTLGIGGGLVATLSQGSYGGNNSSSMTVVASQSILTSALAKTLTIDAILGMSYVIPRELERKIFLENVVVNATFASGTPYLNIYNGTTTNEPLRKEKLVISGIDGKADITDNFSSEDSMPMRIDLVGDVAMTNAYMNLIYRYGR